MRTVLLLTVATFMAPAQVEIRHHREKIAALGTHMAQELLRRHAEITDGPALEYVRQVAAEFGRATAVDRELRVHLVEGTSNFLQEPWAFPGGVLVVPVKLYATAESADEFAAMVAHAVAHSTLENGCFTAARENIADWSSMSLIYMGGCSGMAGTGLTPTQFAGRVRTLELDADARALQFLAAAGYDNGALARYLERNYGGHNAAARPDVPALDQRLAGLPAAPAAQSRDLTRQDAFAAAKEHATSFTRLAERRPRPPSLCRNKR